MIDSKLVVGSLNSALVSVCESLTESQTSTINEYIYVGEWGLALETLCSFLHEEDVNISQESYTLIEQAGERLAIANNTWKILESQIKV